MEAIQSVQSARQRAKRKKKKVSKSAMDMKILDIIWTALCIAGSVYQAFILSSDYFTYPVTAEMVIELKADFFIPATSICLEPHNVLKLDQFPPGHPCLVDNWSPGCRTFLLYNTTVSNLMNNLTNDLTQRMISIKISKPSGTGDTLTGSNMMSHFSSFYKSGYKCLRINKNQTEMINFDVVTKRKFDSRYIFRLTTSYLLTYYNQNNPYGDQITPIYIFFHRFNTYPRGYIASFYKGNFRRAFYYTLAAKCIKMIYLPAPFFSKCSFYAKRGLESREHCIENCVANLIHRNIGDNLTDIQMTITDFSTPQKLIDYEGKQEYEKPVHGYNKACHKLCPHDCNTFLYTPVWFYESRNSSRFPVGTFGFDLIHIEPRIDVKFSPKYQLIEFLTYLASITSLWFGFVFLDFLKYPRICMKHFHQKNRTQVNQVQIINRIEY